MGLYLGHQPLGSQRFNSRHAGRIRSVTGVFNPRWIGFERHPAERPLAQPQGSFNDGTEPAPREWVAERPPQRLADQRCEGWLDQRPQPNRKPAFHNPHRRVGHPPVAVRVAKVPAGSELTRRFCQRQKHLVYTQASMVDQPVPNQGVKMRNILPVKHVSAFFVKVKRCVG